ncbi:toll/interleukin-1 receptor domain-containing protein [Nitrogeniibacter mangrovi]|uniref:Toll/interleukin-1 receptor domain-containing protein n=1 Tax=Nitrogeniibacter mangrovi TaxID=2016596 RepID=A0A6C1B405_9RHOO|nr:toll/interleukin-1 receptor domain-containing protein [Nitrogeniibacter mangrovi]QID17578.1 toll/interleukin-1 receptor domain-containing protein [Nitrogeniibacter mangrovi]
MTLSDIFVSYSRRDAEFVRQLTERLQKAGLDVWIDWEDIPYSSNWWDEISQAVEGASAFVCVLSDEYFASETCRAELKLAEEANKRIIPVCYKDFDRKLNHSNAVAKTNWLMFSGGDHFDASFDALIDTLNADLPWRKFHSRLQVRASEWAHKHKDSSYHLYGQDLDEAVRHLEQSKDKSPPPTTLQLNYIEASKAGAKEVVRKQLRGFYWAALAYSIVQVFVIYFWDFDSMSETAMIKMSWVWLPGLSFALGGLTVGRYRMRPAVAVMAVFMALFAVFYSAIWPLL